MNKIVLTIILIVLAFSSGVVADETLKPDGWSWQRISYVRQLGFFEGFVSGTQNESTMRTFEPACEKNREPIQGLESICILSRLWGNAYVGSDAGKTIETMNRFYGSPRNLPIDWGHAVIISQAMVSGLPISEKDLEEIRKDDATPPKPVSEDELHDILSHAPPTKQ